MLSNLHIVLLSNLLKTPHTGYDMTKLIKKSPWHASHQQVYRELAKLERFMMVACQYIPQQGKPDKKSYSITEQGRVALADPELLVPTMKKMQDEASAMLFLGNPAYFQNLITEIMRRLTALEILKQEAEPLTVMAINREQRLLEADAEWCQEVISVFSSQNQKASQAA